MVREVVKTKSESLLHHQLTLASMTFMLGNESSGYDTCQMEATILNVFIKTSKSQFWHQNLHDYRADAPGLQEEVWKVSGGNRANCVL